MLMGGKATIAAAGGPIVGAPRIIDLGTRTAAKPNVLTSSGTTNQTVFFTFMDKSRCFSVGCCN